MAGFRRAGAGAILAATVWLGGVGLATQESHEGGSPIDVERAYQEGTITHQEGMDRIAEIKEVRASANETRSMTFWGAAAIGAAGLTYGVLHARGRLRRLGGGLSSPAIAQDSE